MTEFINILRNTSNKFLHTRTCFYYYSTKCFSNNPPQISLTLLNGQKMPAVGLGTWQAKTDEEVEKVITVALESGYRHIDTAYVYENEQSIGAALKKWFSSGKIERKDLFITTKLPMIGIHPDRVQLFLDRSLKNLQLDYIDLYLIHFPIGCKFKEGIIRPYVDENGKLAIEPETNHIEIWKKMEEQVAIDKTKSIGLSNFNLSQISRIFNSATIKPAVLQIENHVYLQQKELTDFCQKNNIVVVAYSPLANPGYNKYMEQIGRKAKPLPDILSDPLINKLSKKYSKTPAQIALRFLLQREIAVILKSVTPKRIQENLDIFNFNLDNDEMHELYSLDVGESARVYDFSHHPGNNLSYHPEFPFLQR